MGQQSVAKTIFLLASMVGWLIVGAALMYLFPWVADAIVSSELTHRWMITLGRGGYAPLLGLLAGGIAFAITTAANVVWYRRFDGKL
ncbi:MAG: hypothetical protein WBA57_11595 [Elainellaceae cyanobacterium]